ncbi:MAG TPA: hypothetical protein VEG63_02695, partial [Candidatus Acidoferrales bacterium]|nr:hypothetical protein [Candidatus Acidoferrales bacterium]
MTQHVIYLHIFTRYLPEEESAGGYGAEAEGGAGYGGAEGGFAGGDEGGFGVGLRGMELGVEGHGEDFGEVKGVTVGALGDLLAATEAVGDD